MFRSVVGGGKGGGSAYDPQIGAATQATAATAAKAEAFSEKYYNEVITPLLQQQQAASTESQGKLNTMYDLNADQMRLAMDRYQKFGIPAEDRYYQTVAKYSEPEEMERQAQAAKGDLETAAAGQNQNMMRQMSSLGIDPTSPAATSAMADMAVANTAAQAGAMNRARNAARTLGLQLTSDAANFGRGGTSQAIQFGSNAQGNTTSAFGTANQALQTGMQAGNGVMQGYQTALSGYNNNANVYGGLGQADIQAKAAATAGMWGGLGSMVGAGAGIWAAKSDIRTKENIRDTGVTLPSGIKIYTFEYKPEFKDAHGHGTHMGVMAQEVLPIIPEAVVMGDDGYLEVIYEALR